MNTRTRGKAIAQIAGASLIATSTIGAAALAVETYQDINHQKTQSASVSAPITQNNDTSNTTTETEATDTSITDTTEKDDTDNDGNITDTGPSTTYVQVPPPGAGPHGSSSGS